MWWHWTNSLSAALRGHLTPSCWKLNTARHFCWLNNYLIYSLVKLSDCQKVEIKFSGRFVQQDQNDNWPPDSTSEDQAQCAVHTIGKSSEAGFGLVVTALAGCREGGKSLGRASLPTHCLLTSSCLSLLGVFVTSVQLIWPALLTALCWIVICPALILHLYLYHFSVRSPQLTLRSLTYSPFSALHTKLPKPYLPSPPLYTQCKLQMQPSSTSTITPFINISSITTSSSIIIIKPSSNFQNVHTGDITASRWGFWEARLLGWRICGWVSKYTHEYIHSCQGYVCILKW